MQHTIILCPIYYDEASFHRFAAEVEQIAEERASDRISFLVVNDGTPHLKLSTRFPLHLIHLQRNMGHQKAIAIGLAYANQHLEYDRIIIADSDGEDKPGDIFTLIEMAEKTGSIIVANRISRQESRSFQFFYRIYKNVFFSSYRKKDRLWKLHAFAKKRCRQAYLLSGDLEPSCRGADQIGHFICHT